MATRSTRRQARQNLYKALSHELRGEILTIVSGRQASPAELSRELDEPIDTVDYHVSVLVKLKCAKEVRRRKVRGATEHFYRSTVLHFVDTDDWEALDAGIKMSETGQFMQAQIDAFVASAEAGIVGRDKHFHLTCTPRQLDEEGRDETMEIYERFRLELDEVEGRSAERIAANGESAIPFSSALAFIEMPAP